MTSSTKYYYVYLIEFSNKKFYIGVRQSSVPPEEDVKYWGSPVTHKALWEDKTLDKKKTIIKTFDNYQDANICEKKLIKKMWTKENSLNENIGGIFSDEARLRGIQAKNAAIKEKYGRWYELVSPTGETFIMKGLSRAFCKEHKFNRGTMHRVLIGKGNHSNGWSGRRL